jgi:hypothetical protein
VQGALGCGPCELSEFSRARPLLVEQIPGAGEIERAPVTLERTPHAPLAVRQTSANPLAARAAAGEPSGEGRQSARRVAHACAIVVAVGISQPRVERCFRQDSVGVEEHPLHRCLLVLEQRRKCAELGTRCFIIASQELATRADGERLRAWPTRARAGRA